MATHIIKKRTRRRRYKWFVDHNAKTGMWSIKKGRVLYAARKTKREAVARAAELCSWHLENKQELSELLIRNKASGQWHAPRTYGSDPRKSKG
jgi:hypothetical protein